MTLQIFALQNAGGLFGSFGLLVIPLLLIVLMYFFMIRPQKKQERKIAEQRKNMQVGDQVVSIGGIMGRVVNIKETEVTIESSVAGTLLTFRKEAINQVVKPEDAAAEAKKKA